MKYILFFSLIMITLTSKAQYNEVVDSVEWLNGIIELDRENLKNIKGANTGRFMLHPLFEWPLKQADGFNDPEVYAISNFVDHDTSAGVLDYMGLSRTYDGHRGVDIRLSPFRWKKMAANQVEVVAAADGEIWNTGDGNFDQNCEQDTNATWNFVQLLHADSSISTYGHLKSGSLTNKVVGDMVTTGEYLGLVGSSGFSDTPHLHFQIRDMGGNLIDPFSGPSNSLNPDTWWADQLPYFDSGVNKIMTLSQASIGNDCPQPASVFEEDVYVEDDSIHFSIRFRADLSVNTSTVRVYEPDGDLSDILNVVYQQASLFRTESSARWPRRIPANAEMGKWTYEVEYSTFDANPTYQKEFWVAQACAVGNLNLVGLHSTDQYYQSESIITSTANVPVGVHTVYNAGNYAVLSPGFVASSGSELDVKAEGCN